MNRRGFSIYLTFLVTTIVFLLVTGSQDISVISLDISRSDAIDVIVFHAADGGLERGLAKIRKEFSPFTYSYNYSLKPNRMVKVTIQAFKNLKTNTINLQSEAILLEGMKEVSRLKVSRIDITNASGREGCGKFMEAI